MKNGIRFTLGIIGTIGLASLALFSLLSVRATPSAPSAIRNFYSAQHPENPPLPCVPFEGLNVYYLSNDAAMYDDLEINYEKLAREATFLDALESAMGGPTGFGESGESGSPMGESGYDYPSNVLWIEITGVSNSQAYLTLHGTVEFEHYQLLSQTNLNPAAEWTLGQIITGASGTNQTDFAPVNIEGVSNLFFRAHHAEAILDATMMRHAYESNALFAAGVGEFSIGTGVTDDVMIYYRLSGTASNGVDYTNLVGSVFAPGGSGPTVYIHPYGDSVLEGDETVTLTLVQTNGYLIDPASASATVLIKDFSTFVHFGLVVDAVEVDGPPGVAAQAGSIVVTREDGQNLYPPLTVGYSIAGTALNGTDYATLSGAVTFLDGITSTNLVIAPLADTLVEGLETVIVTLVPTNTCAVDTNAATATIADSTTTVFVSAQQQAIEPHPLSNIPKQTGIFSISRDDTRGAQPVLTVSYQVTGTATAGIDYTNLTGTVTIPAGLSDTSVFIESIFDGQLEGDESVILTLTHVGDGYVISPTFAAATNTIQDNLATNTIQKVADLAAPAGIDYYQPSNSLIVSVNFESGETNNFVRIFSNLVSGNIVTVVTNWSGVHGVPDEVKLVTVKTTGNGFTNGETFFGSDKAIGWLSASGASFNTNWCVLTNSVQTNALHLRGSLCLDETGVFSNHVIAVTSSGGAADGKKGVWRVDANRNPALVANIDTLHLEGVIVLTNDVAKWGPWAGKIITGDEEQSPPVIYTITTNGVVTTNDTTLLIAGGIHTEDFEIIPPGQDFYGCDLFGNALLKVSRDYFTNYVGQLLITEGADFNNVVGQAKLFAVRWDAATTNFVTRKILTFPNALEHVTFAPVNLPPSTP